jgi:VanZ family protein
MGIIFAVSATPASQLPDFNRVDLLIKKGSHFSGYALLSLAYFYALRFSPKKIKLALLLAFFYAISDEFHQSFVAGRHASWVDVLIDGSGAALALLWAKKKFSE